MNAPHPQSLVEIPYTLNNGEKLVNETFGTANLERRREGTLDPRPQEASEATPAPPLRKEDGLIDWYTDASGIANQVRGKAGAHQHPNARIGLAAAGSGFAMQYQAAVILGREAGA